MHWDLQALQSQQPQPQPHPHPLLDHQYSNPNDPAAVRQILKRQKIRGRYFYRVLLNNNEFAWYRPADLELEKLTEFLARSSRRPQPNRTRTLAQR